MVYQMRQECNHLEEGLSDELMLTREEEEEIDVRLVSSHVHRPLTSFILQREIELEKEEIFQQIDKQYAQERQELENILTKVTLYLFLPLY
jgi:cell division ATPase FtsA